ncbi:MAG: EamA family transporter [Selenomonadaceae bacterium]|nr:EamA family transporter [Selenomonadaceae bacterium]
MFRALSLICLIWGFNFVAMKVAADFFTPELFVTYRFGLGAAVLLAFTYFTKQPLPPKKFWGWIVLTGAFQIAIGAAILQTCFKYLDAGLVSVLNYTMPIWVTILAKFFLNESLTRKKIFGIILSVFGVGILMNVDISGDFSAMLMALSAAIFWAIGNVIMKAKLSKLNPISLTTWQMTTAAIMLAIYTAIFTDAQATWTFTAVATLLYNAVIASSLAFFLWAYVLENMEAGKASISVLGVPVVGVISGVIFLGEPLTLTMVFGISMVLAGIFLVQHS